MDNRLEEFNTRLSVTSARFYNSEIVNMDVLDRGFRINKPMGSDVPYLSLEKKDSKLKADDFMLCIGIAPIGENGATSKIFEQDVLDYTFSDKRGVGVIVYDPESYSWAVKDMKTKTAYSFRYIKINKILGNLYTCGNLVGCDIDEAYARLGKKSPLTDCTQSTIKNTSEADAGASPLSPATSRGKTGEDIDVFVKVDILSDKSAVWSYKLQFGDKTKEDSQKFKKAGENSGYYYAAAGIIALSKLNKTKRAITLYTPNEALAGILQNDQLNTWAKNGWKKPTGEIVKNSGILQELNGHIARLGGNITAQVCSPDFSLAHAI